MLIGLAGYARSGKDTVGDLLCAEHGFERTAIADPLRAILLTIDPVVRRQVDNFGWDAAKATGSTRHQLQMLGQALGEQFGKDFMIQHALYAYAPERRLVVTDIRTLVEADVIRSQGGFVIRVERDGVGPANNHYTERIVNPVDAIIVNDGSKEQLSEIVIKCLDKLTTRV
jgi:dephospho-CoA kinase